MRLLFGDGRGFASIFKEVVSPSLWVAWGMTSFVVALAGPFGTFDSQPFIWRLTYWSGLIAAAILIAISCRTVFRHLLGGRPEWQEDLAVSVSMAMIFGPIVITLNRVVGGPEAYQAVGWLAAIGCIFTITIGTIAIRRALREPAPVRHVKVARDRLLARIPAAQDARLARISSDNHHIRVTTNDGTQHRILMRLRDAVQEVDVEPGLYVHRSHWVAMASIADVIREQGREMVRLTCGAKVPVGPKYRPDLIRAGVISE